VTRIPVRLPDNMLTTDVLGVAAAPQPLGPLEARDLAEDLATARSELQILTLDLEAAREEIALLKQRDAAPRPGWSSRMEGMYTDVLVDHLHSLHDIHEQERDPIIKQALHLRIGECEREIAIRNARQVAELDAADGIEPGRDPSCPYEHLGPCRHKGGA
jgi:hypothetical protein